MGNFKKLAEDSKRLKFSLLVEFFTALVSIKTKKDLSKFLAYLIVIFSASIVVVFKYTILM